MREYVPYKWCYDTLRCLELKPKCRKKNVSTKLVPLETKGVPLVSLLLSVFFFPVFLFLPVLLALPQPPCTQCARVTSFWSAFLKLSVHLDFEEQIWLYLEATAGETHLFSPEKNPASQYIFIYFVLNSNFSKMSSTQN